MEKDMGLQILAKGDLLPLTFMQNKIFTWENLQKWGFKVYLDVASTGKT